MYILNVVSAIKKDDSQGIQRFYQWKLVKSNKISYRKQLLFNETSKKTLSFATKLTQKIPDPINNRECYQYW